MIHVCALADLPRGSARRLPLTPPVSVFHTDTGELYAIDDTCTHQDASLADGFLEGCEIECPLHGGAFNIRTGEPVAFPVVVPVETYGVRIEGDEVQVAVKS
jgi:3-phenylpropionate/trans-cinnamate dioxygenase ferredoxin subunit